MIFECEMSDLSIWCFNESNKERAKVLAESVAKKRELTVVSMKERK